MEYIAAETLLQEQPFWVVTISGVAPSGEMK